MLALGSAQIIIARKSQCLITQLLNEKFIQKMLPKCKSEEQKSPIVVFIVEVCVENVNIVCHKEVFVVIFMQYVLFYF